ncbi:MAG: hypothetical protein ACKOBW_12625 [Planctomycetota bacterium]
MKTPAPSPGLALAQQAFADKGIRFPPIPELLAQRLERIDDWIFASRTPPWWPHDIDDYVIEVKHQVPEEPVADYVLLAYVGRGATPNTLCYYLVHQQVRIFLQILFDTPGGELQEDLQHIKSVWKHLSQLLAARDAGWLLPGETVTVVGTDIRGTSCQLSSQPHVRPINYRQVQDALPRLIKFLKKRAQANSASAPQQSTPPGSS